METYEYYDEKYGQAEIFFNETHKVSVSTIAVVFRKRIELVWYYHRLDGPTVIYDNGRKEWWINGFGVTTPIRSWAKDNDIDLDNLTNDDKVLINLAWSDHVRDV